MRGFFGRGVYNGVETQPGGGEDVQEQEMIAQLLQQDERGMEALLLHYGPLMRYIIAPILPDPQDREECLSEVSMRVWSRIAQFDPARGSWNAWLTAVTRSTALNYQRSAARHGGTQTLPEGAPSPEASPEEALIQAERRAALHDALVEATTGPDMAHIPYPVTPRSERPGAVLSEVLLPAVHRTDRRRARHDRARGRGSAVPSEKTAAHDVGR